MTQFGILRELTAHEVGHVSGGSEFEEFNPAPEGGDSAIFLSSGATGILVAQHWSQPVVRALQDLAVGLLTNLLYDELTQDPNEQWVDTPPSPAHTQAELGLGNFVYQLGTGNHSLTQFNDFRLTASGDGTFQGTYVGTSEALIFVAQDQDGDGAIDHVYMKRQSLSGDEGEWYVATSTTNGEPNWQPASAPKSLENLAKGDTFEKK
jgi:hypothetical protein